ncbi:MAG: bifunctional N(6)-L-threonylcarbamoyladenine synthase/serine/threonine protein kinase [Candidatus Methanomethylophilaceae archaeon]|nr:bifunctional N(6)-L-threonylcarbamoyladenine synthase/serine/threonine protein kinase [Candidatus Methanomethylophilaceae archaeon]
MITLGIEGTAHTLGVGIVDSDRRVYANEVDMFRPKEGGLHPREAANHHADVVARVMNDALDKAGMRLGDIDLVSFSMGPGLGPCLRVAATAARALSSYLDVPIVGVNHCIAHIEIGRALTGCADPALLYASGGNTQVIAYSAGRYRIFGETQDIGIGNMLDKLGRELGMGFYAGPVFEKLAKDGVRYHELPYSVKGMDVAFSGLMTAALALHRDGVPLEDIAFSVQETAFAMLTEVTERAMAHTGKDQVLLGGGVAQNARLREMVQEMAEERGAEMFVPDRRFCMDNGAMIAWLGSEMYSSGVRMDIADTEVRQRFRTDEVPVTWRSRSAPLSSCRGSSGTAPPCRRGPIPPTRSCGLRRLLRRTRRTPSWPRTGPLPSRAGATCPWKRC